MPELNAYDVTVKYTPRAREKHIYTRFAPSLEAARENAEKVLVREQGMTLISVVPAAVDPRSR